jgi:hypothetical protein
MAKDYYSGAPRKASDIRRGKRDRIVNPAEARIPGGTGLLVRSSDDELSNILVDAGIIKNNQPKALSTIRSEVAAKAGMLQRRLVRSGEEPVDAANAIRGRMGKKLVPQEFTTTKNIRGRGDMGTLKPGARVRVRSIGTDGNKLTWNVVGKTEGGRSIGQSIDNDDIGGYVG